MTAETPLAHPLGPLTAAEITAATALVRKAWPEGTLFQFKVVTLQEPPKAELVPYLAAERAGTAASSLPVIPRRVYVAYYLRNTHKFHEAMANLSTGTLERNVRLPADKHANGDGEEILAIEQAVLADPGVRAAVAKLQLPEGAVLVSDPWIYGSDGVCEGLFRDDVRVMQCFLYMRDPNNAAEPDSCHYAFPLPISPVVDCATLEVVRIDVLPTGLDAITVKTVDDLPPWQPAPPSEYIPEAQAHPRADLKPLRVVQPEGASFQVAAYSAMGRRVTWQKWDVKVGFNQREGMVLYDVHYDGRPLFYRLSLSDMAIPYADPRHPFHKKQAFDLGDVGAGIMANNLQLGCDCLGAIYYMDGVVADAAGAPHAMPNVVCVHEQDAGIAWKHTNYRTDRAVVVRQRELVLQTILTVSNYEYILAWVFNLAGDIAYEVRATGIVSTQPVDRDLEAQAAAAGHPFGTVVHPGVLAGHHQHFFSLRVDPMVAGHGNTVVYQDTVALPRDPRLNPHGVGYTVATTPLTTSGPLDIDTAATGRVVHITNPAVRHPVNGLPAAYKVHLPPMQPILADADSFHRRRAQFADHPVYVTRYADGELYAGGTWTNQSRGDPRDPDGGVRTWAARQDSLAAGDPVVWLQFGLNHVPRAEDFPVMPCETLRVTLRPVNVFVQNPALDVPASSQAVNGSVLVDGAEATAHGANGTNGTGASCCT
ncbi:primary-amine oxidase [Sporothrix schenckii 1099-18]|uniref:Amine oxidase n=1 Tax=Sporothrix schenckii 1099-18 TaxID=1397361 RepID=A0A0F2MGT8_SPOSC|nr:primary-amine oxidase [Sporothrix schenckii 1099-18]KJR88913.1 primary-amine oxidase [Sporothrix schenckii 1099-18]